MPQDDLQALLTQFSIPLTGRFACEDLHQPVAVLLPDETPGPLLQPLYRLKGLAVVGPAEESSARGWSVTHEASGGRLVHCDTLAEAVLAVQTLHAGTTVDWRLGLSDLKQALLGQPGAARLVVALSKGELVCIPGASTRPAPRS